MRVSKRRAKAPNFRTVWAILHENAQQMKELKQENEEQQARREKEAEQRRKEVGLYPVRYTSLSGVT